MNRTLLLPEELAGMEEEGPSVLIVQFWDSAGEEEISEVEADILFQAWELAMEQDEVIGDQNEDSGKDSDIDAESHQEGQISGNESNYIPSNIRGYHRCAGMSCKSAGAPNLPKKFMHNQGTKDSHEGSKQKKKNLAYKFCPPPH